MRLYEFLACLALISRVFENAVHAISSFFTYHSPPFVACSLLYMSHYDDVDLVPQVAGQMKVLSPCWGPPLRHGKCSHSAHMDTLRL